MKDRPWLNWAISAALAIAAAYIGARWGIVIPTVPPVVPPAEPGSPPTPPPRAPEPLAAICKIGMEGGYCSGAVIGPRRPDGRCWVISASHCFARVGERVSLRFRDGRTGGAIVTNLERQADYAWLVTDADGADYPFALLADRTPPVGSRLWHAGYGVDRPGNREDGELTAGPNSEGQIRMRLNVSNGDSGGGIALDADGRIVSTVCCTAGRGQFTDTWGTSVESARAGQRDTKSFEDWQPREIPLKKEHAENPEKK